MCGRLEEIHSYSEKGILAPSPGPRWFIDHLEMRDEAGRQRATFLFLSFTGCEEGGSFMACLTESWLHPSPGRAALWPPLIAGIDDGRMPLALWLRWVTLGMEREKGSFVTLSFPPQSGLLESPEERHRLLDQGMTPIKWFFMFLKRMSCFS